MKPSGEKTKTQGDNANLPTSEFGYKAVLTPSLGFSLNNIKNFAALKLLMKDQNEAIATMYRKHTFILGYLFSHLQSQGAFQALSNVML